MAHLSLSASELKHAVLDPIWRASWLAGERPATRTFAPQGTPRALGAQFHSEAQRLVRWLTARDSLGPAARIDSADALLEQVWASSLQSFTDRLFLQGWATEAAAFTERMRRFCERLIELKRRTRGFENWQDVFIAAEQRLGAIAVPAGDQIIEIRARVDAIRIHPQGHLEVVDYKLSQGCHQKADLVQLAIYAHLLSRWRPGCEFCGTLEYYLPELAEVPVSRADLADIYNGTVAPVLDELLAGQAPRHLQHAHSPSARPLLAAHPPPAPVSQPHQPGTHHARAGPDLAAEPLV
jgi:S-DNA-T family DNA segregation ATPase FtsK/SpoIIIE